MSGFIIGFDGERSGAGRRIVEFIEETGIPQCQFSLLQALQNTAMWKRLQEEGRLRADSLGTFHQGAIMNFVPTRPVEDITEEYIDAFWRIYEPIPYLKRTFRHMMMMKGWRGQTQRRLTQTELSLFLGICWRQGVLRSTRFCFWWQIVAISFLKPRLLFDYLVTLGAGEHFFSFRHEVRAQLQQQLATLKTSQSPIQKARTSEVTTQKPIEV